MNVFVTGATGNIGRPTVAELHRRGHAVTALVRRRERLDGCRTVVGDLSEIHTCAGEIAAADAIVHLASPRSNRRDIVLLEDIIGTSRLLELWHRGNFVYLSSQTVYGVPRQRLTESLPLSGTCWYDLGKICNEGQVNVARQGVAVGAGVSLRLPLLFGHGPRRNDRQWLPQVYRHCLGGGVFLFDSEEGIETYGSSFIGEQDGARAVADALGITESGAYNIAGGFCTWRELIETIDRHAGTRSRLVVRPDAEPGPREYRLPQSRSMLDTSMFTTHTGFKSEEDLDSLVREFVDSERPLAAASRGSE